MVGKKIYTVVRFAGFGHLFQFGDGWAVETKGAMGAPFPDFHLADALGVMRVLSGKG